MAGGLHERRQQRWLMAAAGRFAWDVWRAERLQAAALVDARDLEGFAQVLGAYALVS